MKSEPNDPGVRHPWTRDRAALYAMQAEMDALAKGYT
jgi:hypothetical protein